jgi:hypothetical protein
VNKLDLGELKKGQFYSFLGGFNRNLYSRFKHNPDLFSVKINYKGVARSKNYQYWDTLEDGTYFYNIDLSSAYWQIAYRLGYLSDKLFQTYLELDAYKHAKRYCVSFLARKNKMVYTTEEGKIEIACDTSVFKNVYDNIRNELYKTIQEALIGIENYVEYNIDGVTVMKDDVARVKKAFREEGLKFKVTECRKINDKEYLYGNKIRRFKNK